MPKIYVKDPSSKNWVGVKNYSISLYDDSKIRYELDKLKTNNLTDSPKDNNEYVRKNGEWKINNEEVQITLNNYLNKDAKIWADLSDVPVNREKKILNNIPNKSTSLFLNLPGVTFNLETGFYEIYKNENGLIDVSEKEMFEIYNASLISYAGGIVENSNVRAIIPILLETISPKKYINNLSKKFINCSLLEFIKFSSLNTAIIYGDFDETFCNCPKLSNIANILKINSEHNAFYNNKNLKYIKLNEIENDLCLKDSNILDFTSIKYLIENSKNTKIITIFVNNNIYNLLNGLSKKEDYMNSKFTLQDWINLLHSAKSKQIKFSLN